MNRALCRSVLAVSVILLSGCSARQATQFAAQSASETLARTARLAETGMLLSVGDNLGVSLYNTKKGLLARGYDPITAPATVFASVPIDE